MPNTTLGGLRYRKSLSGATGPTILTLPVATGNSTAIFKGDLIKQTSGGYVDVAAAGDNDIVGVCDGVEQYWDGTQLQKGQYLPASTAYSTNLSRKSVLRIISAADAVFEADTSAATATTEAAWIAFMGENCDIVATAGTTGNGLSGHCIDDSSHAASSKQLRLLEVAQPVGGQDFASARVKLLVKVNKSHLANLAGV